MAEDLDDGEFWLPPQFLTDDDILMDFAAPKIGQTRSDGFRVNSDLDFSSGSVAGSTETESDEDELLAGLTRQMARSSVKDCAVHSKGWVLSSSPKSTLCGCSCNQGSSRGSPDVPVSPSATVVAAAAEVENIRDTTWDLLYKAAGEVARIKKSGASIGTGFFDCTNKGLFCPPPRKSSPVSAINNNYHPPLYSQPQLQHLAQVQQLRKQRLMVGQGKPSNRPLGLPASAWPPLQGRNQPVPSHGMSPSVYLSQPGPKRECAGTGVFLPRRVSNPTETRKKPDSKMTKTRSGKGSSQQRQSSRPPNGNHQEIQLPQEWTY